MGEILPRQRSMGWSSPGAQSIAICRDGWNSAAVKAAVGVLGVRCRTAALGQMGSASGCSEPAQLQWGESSLRPSLLFLAYAGQLFSAVKVSQ